MIVPNSAGWPRHAQSGAGLVVALIMLIVMSLGAIALVRTVETGILISGNFAFRQSALIASDLGSEVAIAWLSSSVSTDLHNDQPVMGYYASVPDGLDIGNSGQANAQALIDWDGDKCTSNSALLCLQPAVASLPDSAGNRVRTIIHRLCRSAGAPNDPAIGCLLYQSPQSSSTKKSVISYSDPNRFASHLVAHYRITTRTEGPRNTIVFSQITVRF